MVTLSDGRTVDYDWTAITQTEWRAMINKDTNYEVTDVIVGKLVGMTAEELSKLNPIDFRKIAVGVWTSFKEVNDIDDAKN